MAVVKDPNGDRTAELVRDAATKDIAEILERRRILERTARGRGDAKANDVKFGRKPKLTPHQQKRGPQAHCRWRGASQHRLQLQCQSQYDFASFDMIQT